MCGTKDNLQVHHICYEPEITVWACVNCHQSIHKKHGIGSPIGWKGYSKKDVEKFIYLWKKGKTLMEISRLLGPAVNTLMRWRDNLKLSNLDRDRIPIPNSSIEVLRAKSIQIEQEILRRRIATITLENGRKIKAILQK